MSIVDSCRHTVRRATGHASTPFTRAYGNEKCGRPTRWLLVTDDGELCDWSCNRHRKNLEAVNPGSLEIVEYKPEARKNG